jgi:endonuclease-3 related protein
MMAGAILTQATNWRNVEQAIARLRRAKRLIPRRLMGWRRSRLEQALRPTGYFRQKAARLAGFARWYVATSGGDASRLFRTPWRTLRRQLLAQNGIGPETADSILLYAGGEPVFVVDAYTRRIFRRHRLISEPATYDDIQELVMRRMPARAATYNELHALLVAAGKRYCHARHPECARCPLGDLPHTTR